MGGNESFHVDVRLVAATNRNLAEEVAEQRFREDLYYRVNVVTITLPPLRSRRSDIPVLANHFLAKYSHVAAAGSRRSAARQWKCCSTTHGRATSVSSSRRSNGRCCCATAIESRRAICRPKSCPKSPLPAPAERGRAERFEIPPEGLNFDNLERDLIMQAMEKADGVIAKAAKMLGMSYRTLQYRLEKFGVKKGDARGLEPK